MGILAGLQADNVVVEEAGEELSGPREDAEDFRRWERAVKEEADFARPAEFSELSTQGEKVVVVDPDQVTGSQEVDEGGGVLAVDASVHLVAVVADGCLAGEGVEERPECLVREDVVEVLDFIPGKG